MQKELKKIIQLKTEVDSGNNFLQAQIDALFNDAETSDRSTYSSEKIEALIVAADRFLGTFTTATRPTGLSAADVGNYILDSTTNDFVFWTGSNWNDKD